jgi:hypothetical protein
VEAPRHDHWADAALATERGDRVADDPEEVWLSRYRDATLLVLGVVAHAHGATAGQVRHATGRLPGLERASLHSLQRAGLVERERRHGGAVWFATPQGTRLGVVPYVTRLLAAIKPLHRGSAAAWSVGRFRNVGTTHGPPIFSPAYKLASVEDPEALGEVIATGAQDDRAYALTKLIALQDPASTRILCEVARGRGAEEPLARQAAVALGSFRTPASIETLIEIAGQRDSIMREAAARSLGRLRAADAVPVLSQLLSFPSEPVRLAAARALGQIGQVASAPALARACADPDRHVRHAARHRWCSLGQRGSSGATRRGSGPCAG